MSKKLIVPSEILRVFKDLYPEVDVTQVEWSWEVRGKIYEAAFELDENEHEVEITVTGHYLLTETEIEVTELPEVVAENVKSDFEEAEIDEVAIVAFSTGDIHYELSLKDEEKAFEVHYREDGVLMLQGRDL